MNDKLKNYLVKAALKSELTNNFVDRETGDTCLALAAYDKAPIDMSYEQVVEGIKENHGAGSAS